MVVDKKTHRVYIEIIKRGVVMTDREKLKAAFKVLRKEGWNARMGECDPDNGRDSVWANYGRQKQIGTNGFIQDVMYLDHEGNAGRVVEVLQAHGLNATWNGQEFSAIKIVGE